MRISSRLRAVASMVTEGNRVADVGCDHGYVPIYLIQNGRIPSAIAMDVNSGPLLRAREHIELNGLSEYIETRLSDGLDALREGEADTVILAGMGGPLMERILNDGREALRTVTELVLEPQSDVAGFRRFLSENGYVIADENMILEDGKYYPIVRAVHGERYGLDEVQARFGPVLLARKNPVLIQFLERERRIRETILSRLDGADALTEDAEKRRQELLVEAAVIEEAWKRCDVRI